MQETAQALDTRQLIIDAAIACIRRVSLRKMTIVDVANAAGVSRGTVYQYFKDKAAIVEATAENLSQRFYREMIKAMAGETTLEGQLSAGAVFVMRARRWLETSESYFDEDELSILLTKNGGALLAECVEFVTPYVNAAKITGEVRRDLDARAASEWFARILFSLFSTPSSTLDLQEPEVVRRFVSDHLVRGFGSSQARRSA